MHRGIRASEVNRRTANRSFDIGNRARERVRNSRARARPLRATDAAIASAYRAVGIDRIASAAYRPTFDERFCLRAAYSNAASWVGRPAGYAARSTVCISKRLGVTDALRHLICRLPVVCGRESARVIGIRLAERQRINGSQQLDRTRRALRCMCNAPIAESWCSDTARWQWRLVALRCVET